MNKYIPSRNNGIDPIISDQTEKDCGRRIYSAAYNVNPVDGTVCVEGSDIVLDMADYRGHDYGSPSDGTVEPAEHYVHDYGHDYDDIPF